MGVPGPVRPESAGGVGADDAADERARLVRLCARLAADPNAA